MGLEVFRMLDFFFSVFGIFAYTNKIFWGGRWSQDLAHRPDPNPHLQPSWPYTELLGSLTQLQVALLGLLGHCLE